MSDTKFKPGDIIKHKRTGETLVVARVRSGRAVVCGWPTTAVKVDDCELVKKSGYEPKDD